MALPCLRLSIRRSIRRSLQCTSCYTRNPRDLRQSGRRFSSTDIHAPKPTDIGFVFDIDGVLLRGSKPIPGARESLQELQKNDVPFILLTNGGGKSEAERIAQINSILDLSLDEKILVQSHTPLKQLVDTYGDKHVLIVGGDGDKCRQVAEGYGFKKAWKPGDLVAKDPSIWPFADKEKYLTIRTDLDKPELKERELSSMKRLPSIPGDEDASSLQKAEFHKLLQFSAIMVFNDSRDWGLDTQVMLDLLLSYNGYYGTRVLGNGYGMRNHGFQQHSQPLLYFTNPDVWWAGAYHLPRLGQGAFMAAFKGAWQAATGRPDGEVKLYKRIIGKPFEYTYRYAEKLLNELHRERQEALVQQQLKSIYVVGDNPRSDITGARWYGYKKSTIWHPMLVRTGVYDGVMPDARPSVITDDVWQAVRLALQHATAADGMSLAAVSGLETDLQRPLTEGFHGSKEEAKSNDRAPMVDATNPAT